MGKSINKTLILIIGILFIPMKGFSHPISLIDADAKVYKDKIQIKIAVMPEDFVIFYRLRPDQNDNFSRKLIHEMAEKHKTFLLKYFNILNGNGEYLEGKVSKVKIFRMKKTGIHGRNLMDKYLFYFLEYKFKEPPKFLTFFQYFGGMGSKTPTTMALNVSLEGSQLEESLDLSNGANLQTVKLDWSNPNPKKRMEYVESSRPQSEIKIGTTNVSMDLIFPLSIVQNWFPIKRKNKLYLDPEEQKGLRKNILLFLKGKNKVFINDKKVNSKNPLVSFESLNEKVLNNVSTILGNVRIKFLYKPTSKIKKLKINWGIFSHNIYRFFSTVYAEGKMIKKEFTSYNPELIWTKI